MLAVRRALLVGAVAAGTLAVPGVASAAPSVVASALPGVLQDCQAGCIGSIRLSCAATDPLSVQTTVRCWTGTASYNALTATQPLPVSVAQGTRYNAVLGSFTLCVEGIARYANGSTAASGVHCGAGDLGTALVVG